ncbi:MAG: hypothetical protein DRO93_11445 [Candidatus Thorarchaeota archaeon]|nr:MAG: hypothetical protein DRO93_11445 [Candidatus Thorarchaeota archaeon]
MGKAYVALYDEDMRRVMMVLFGDSWSGSEKGYFNVYFYPQDSSFGYRSSGYIYTSFRKTAELWWGPFQGGHGAVYASIDGQSDGYPIAECDNASRVIKYVVILGYCCSSYDVVRMRIHDVNVVADLNRHDPTAPDPDVPQEFDGTLGGKGEGTKHNFDSYMDMAEDRLSMYWTGPWPLLHFACNYELETGFSIVFHMTVDLLFTLNVQDSYFGLADDSTVGSQSSLQRAVALCIELSQKEEIQFWKLLTVVEWGTLGLLAVAKMANPYLELVFVALCIAWYASFVKYVSLLVESLRNETPLAAVLVIATLGLMLLFGIYMGWMKGGSTAWQKFNEIFDLQTFFDVSLGEEYRWAYRCRLAFYLVVVQLTALIFLIVVCSLVRIGAL